jgi:hypothetical protein
MASAQAIDRSRMPRASANRFKTTTINRYWMGTMHTVKTFGDPADIVESLKYVPPATYCGPVPPEIGRRCSQHPGAYLTPTIRRLPHGDGQSTLRARLAVRSD